MSFKKQKIILVICMLLVLSTPFLAQARGLVPCGGATESPCKVSDIFVLVARVTNFLIAMAGVLAVYEIIGGGFWLIVSMGNEEDITKRKGQIQSALLGLVLVLMAFMFVNTMVNFFLTRHLVVGNPKCKLDLTNPLEYLRIKDTSQCNSVPDSVMYKK